MKAADWFNKGIYHSVLEHQVFVIDSSEGEINDKPVLCILHGFPTSSYDYHKVLDQLSQYYRVVIHDHLGFGFSDKPIEYSYSLIEQTDIALTLWRQLGIERAVILAHDYGTSVLTEILARDNHGWCPIEIVKITLCNGSMHIEMAKLKLMQKLLRRKYIGPLIAKLTNKRTLNRNLKSIYVDQTQLPEQELDAIWDIISYNDGKNVLAKVSRYTFERHNFWHRWIGALQQTNVKIEIVWPDSDPIAVSAMATTILDETKNSELFWLEELGHFPMLESPYNWSDAVLKQLKTNV